MTYLYTTLLTYWRKVKYIHVYGCTKVLKESKICGGISIIWESKLYDHTEGKVNIQSYYGIEGW